MMMTILLLFLFIFGCVHSEFNCPFSLLLDIFFSAWPPPPSASLSPLFVVPHTSKIWLLLSLCMHIIIIIFHICYIRDRKTFGRRWKHKLQFIFIAIVVAFDQILFWFFHVSLLLNFVQHGNINCKKKPDLRAYEYIYSASAPNWGFYRLPENERTLLSLWRKNL